MEKKLTPQILAMYLGRWCIESTTHGDCERLINGAVIDAFASGKISIKPILRPLHLVTKTEKEVFDSCERFEVEMAGDTVKVASAQMLLALEMGFDLFGLIEAGEAIENTEVL